MTGLRRWASTAPAALCLVAVTGMGAATFLPYMTIPAWWNDGLSGSGAASVYIAGWSLADGTEARLAVVLLAVLAASAIASIARIRRRLSATVALIFSCSLLLFALYASSDGGRHVLPAWTLPGSGGEVAPVEPVGVGMGYALFLAGALVAVVAATILVVGSLWDGFPGMRDAWLNTANPTAR
jgi:hypothetical protein